MVGWGVGVGVGVGGGVGIEVGLGGGLWSGDEIGRGWEWGRRDEVGLRVRGGEVKIKVRGVDKKGYTPYL